nr:MAG: ORF1 [Anelloviridae sp.]
MYHRRRSYRPRRHFFRHRRWRYPRRHWRRAWRRRYRRPRVRAIIQQQPRRKKILVVTGWEILGQIGSQLKYVYDDNTKTPRVEVINIAPMNKQVKYLMGMIPQGLANTCSDTWTDGMKERNEGGLGKTGPTHWDFVGGWGYAKFDLQSLILRNLLGMNRFSENIRTYTHIKFLKFKIQLVPGPSVDYLFRIQQHRGPQDWEEPLLHPAHLLNMPFVTWVQSIKRSKCCRMKVLRRRAGTDLNGWYDMESFRNYELFSYMWSAFDPNNPLGKNPILPGDNKGASTTTKWWNDDWMRARQSSRDQKISINMKLDWTQRNTYDNNFVKSIDPEHLTNETTNFWDWLLGKSPPQGKSSPFVPPILSSEYVNTLWFRYKFYFQIGGASISREAISWPLRETTDNTVPCGVAGCPYCIKEGDTDEHGILKEKALERITESPERRKKRLVEKLSRALRQRRKRKRITWWDEGKAEEYVSTPHTHPKNFKNKCIRRLATRLGL